MDMDVGSDGARDGGRLWELRDGCWTRPLVHVPHHRWWVEGMGCGARVERGVHAISETGNITVSVDPTRAADAGHTGKLLVVGPILSVYLIQRRAGAQLCMIVGSRLVLQ